MSIKKKKLRINKNNHDQQENTYSINYCMLTFVITVLTCIFL